MRALALLSVFLALPALGCFTHLGPQGLFTGVGAVEHCSGEYAYDDAAGRYRCKGEYTSGAPISESGSRMLGALGEPIMRVGAGLAGVPLPAKQPAAIEAPQPPSPPKHTGP